MKSAVIVAGGNSNRYGKNKLNEGILGRTVLDKAADVFCGIADEIIVVGEYERSGVKVVGGGKTRQQSVLNGLNAVSPNCDVVAVHDGARPFVSRELVSRLFAEAEAHGSAVPKTTVTDTMYKKCANGMSICDRNDYFTVETPQVFSYKMLLKSFETQGEFTDESSRFSATFGCVNFVDAPSFNGKITYVGDLPVYRIGNGFDVHAFTQGDCVKLGGVLIPFDKKLVGHSDADVVIHAICDAILSAVGSSDIGVLFPDTSDEFLGIDSSVLLSRVVKIAREKGYEVDNVTAVVICQAPKIAPFTADMQSKIASVIGISSDLVTISATTTEHLGALGNGDGIACQSTALVHLVD